MRVTTISLLSSFVCLLAAPLVRAGTSSADILRPQVILGLSSDLTGSSNLGGVEPHLKWSASRQMGECDVSGGLDLTVKDVVVEPDALPYSIWGTIKSSLLGWNLQARMDADSVDLETVHVDLRASQAGTALQMTGRAGAKDVAVDNVKLSQELDGLGGNWKITPRYSVAGSTGDVSVQYGLADTGTTIVVDASKNKQTVTVSQKIGDKNLVAPSITTDGELDLQYTRALATGAVAIDIKPNDHVNVNWHDGPWQANFNAPLDGLTSFNEGMQVNVRRVVNVM